MQQQVIFTLLSAHFQNYHLIYQYAFRVLSNKYFINNVKGGIHIRAHFMLYFKEYLDEGKGLQKSGYVYKHRNEKCFEFHRSGLRVLLMYCVRYRKKMSKLKRAC